MKEKTYAKIPVLLKCMASLQWDISCHNVIFAGCGGYTAVFNKHMKPLKVESKVRAVTNKIHRFMRVAEH